MATAKSIMDNFIKKGFPLLGAGAYAAVFDSKVDPNLVYKIGSTLNDPFLAYLDLKEELAGNPHFPKIYSTYIDKENDWYMVKMEALTPVPDHKRPVVKEIRQLILGEETSHEKPELQKIANTIASMLQSHDEMQLDLHSLNIMMRGLVPVITDPVSELDIPTCQDVESWVYKGESYDERHASLCTA